jgi:hypothetical protein
MIDLIATALAGGCDFKTKHIPNLITFPLILYGFFTGVDFPVFIIALALCVYMDWKEIWHEGDSKLIVGLSLAAPERFFTMIVGTWLTTAPISAYIASKKAYDYRMAYAPFVFLGVLFSYIWEIKT